MSDLFTRLTGRALGQVPVAQPLVRSRYAGPVRPDSANVGAEELEASPTENGLLPPESGKPSPARSSELEVAAPGVSEPAEAAGNPAATQRTEQQPSRGDAHPGPTLVESEARPRPTAGHEMPATLPASTSRDETRHTLETGRPALHPPLGGEAAEVHADPPAAIDGRAPRTHPGTTGPPVMEIPFDRVLVPSVPPDSGRQPPMVQPSRPEPLDSRLQAGKAGRQETPTVHVSIGRIEIRADRPERRTLKELPQPSAPEMPKTDLAAYLKERNEGRR